jgi:hypothetical protein
VTMSFSSASLQKGRLYLRQKARLHCLHDVEASRAARKGKEERPAAGVAVSGSRVVLLGSEGVDDETGGGGAGLLLLSCCGPRGMMVLFLKQVHLQNVGTAFACQSQSRATSAGKGSVPIGKETNLH